MNHHVKIGVHENGTGYVLLDGKEINTEAVGFNASIDGETEVTLVISASVEVEAEVAPAKLRLVKRVSA